MPIPTVRCPRCKTTADFADDAEKVCATCNFPGPEVRLERRAEANAPWFDNDPETLRTAQASGAAMTEDAGIGAAGLLEEEWPEEDADALDAMVPAMGSPAVPTHGPEGAEDAGTGRATDAGPASATPRPADGEDQGTTERPTDEGLDRMPGLDDAQTALMRRRFLLPDDEPILAYLTAASGTAGVRTLALTDRRLHALDPTSGRARLTADLRAVQWVAIERGSFAATAVIGAVGGLALLIGLLLLTVAQATSVGVVVAAAGLVLAMVAFAFLPPTTLTVGVAAMPRPIRVRLGRAAHADGARLADRVLAQKDACP